MILLEGDYWALLEGMQKTSNETERLNWSLTAFAYTVDNAIKQL